MSTRNLTVIVLIALGVIVLVPLLAMPMGWGMMGMGGGGTVGLVLPVVLGFVVFLLFRRQDGDVGRLLSGSPRPLDSAKERYARGEITREQYEQLRKDLGE
jgi:putative membrane protein